MDVTEIEPVESHDPLWVYQMRSLPHIWPVSRLRFWKSAQFGRQKTIRVLTGKAPWGLANPEVIKTIAVLRSTNPGRWEGVPDFSTSWLFSGTFGVAANQVTTFSTFTVHVTRRTSFNYLSVKASTAAIHSGYSVFYSLDVVSFNSSSRFLTHVAGKKRRTIVRLFSSRRAGFTRSCKRTQHPCSRCQRQLVVGNCCHGQSDALPCQTNARTYRPIRCPRTQTPQR